MRIMLIKEFEELYREYQNVSSTEERRIRLKLNEICLCYDECRENELDFANEITKKFCEIIEIMKKQNDDERKKIISEYDSIYATNEGGFNYVPLSEGFGAQEMRYRYSDELLDDFYNYYTETHTEATVKDYTARIKTFADRYMCTIPHVWEMYMKESEDHYVDPVLFTYKHLELILATFNTKDENGISNKQKNNIRSALRKLNDFKQRKEHRIQ